VPEQQFSTLIPWMMEKYGKKVYTIAADYTSARSRPSGCATSSRRKAARWSAEEFIPLSVSQFSQTIQNIQKAKPDVLVTLLVGANQASFYEQQASANLNIPMASSVNVGQAYEHKRFKPPALKDMYVTANYVEEVVSPASDDFKKRFRASSRRSNTSTRRPPTPTTRSTCTRPASRRRSRPIKPRSRPRSAAAVSAPMDRRQGVPRSEEPSHEPPHLPDPREGGSFGRHPEGLDDIEPYWLGQVGCDLSKKPDQNQYTPSNLPKK